MVGRAFISHASADADTATRVVAILEAQEVPCWVAPRDIAPGAKWPERIVAALEGSCALVVLVSARANESEEIERELAAAGRRKLPIFPIRIEDVPTSNKLAYFVENAQWLTAYGGVLEDQLAPLVAALRPLQGNQPPARTVEPPRGTVTALAAHVDALWAQHGQLLALRLDALHAQLAQSCAAFGGIASDQHSETATYVFALASDATQAAVEIQCKLAQQALSGPKMSLRLGLHTGEPTIREVSPGRVEYSGPMMGRASAIASAAHGGQTLVSKSTQALAFDTVFPIEFRDLGFHRLRGLATPEQVFQIEHPDLPREFAPISSLDNVPHNLPTTLTSFVGRERELGYIADTLSTGERRLLSLVGPGGGGKTRLALQAAGRALEMFVDGVWFVPLAEIREAERVGPAIAKTIGLQLRAEPRIEEQLARTFHNKKVLLVLDNFEQVTTGKRLVSDLLQIAKELIVVITSRENLGIQGEREIFVDPLEIPPRQSRGPKLQPSGAWLGPEVLTQYASVRLFLERAKDVRPGFAITERNAPAIAELCVRLDGIPLAIELAAARIRMMSPEQLLARIADRFNVLAGGINDRPVRQQTLRNTIDWSYELLTDGEKQVFQRLSVFAGGFTIEAAEAVCETDNAFEIITSLFDKSLVQRRELENDERFLMLESVRAYAAEKQTDPAIARRAAQFFLRALEREVTSHGVRERYRRIDFEYDNLMHLVHVCFGEGVKAETEREQWWPLVARLADALREYMWARGLWDDELALIEKALVVHEASANWVGAGRDAYAAAWVHCQRGSVAEARRWAERCQALMAQAATAKASSLPNHALGLVALRDNRSDDARRHFMLALDGQLESAGAGSEASIKMELGHVARVEQNLGEARRWYEAALQLNLRTGAHEGVAICRGYLALLLELTGDHAGAKKEYRAALELALDVGRQTTVARCRVGLARILRRDGEEPAASAEVGEALQIYGRLHMYEEIEHVRREFGLG